MKTVIVDRSDIQVSVAASQLKLDDQKLPLKMIELLVLSHDTSLSSSTLIKLSKENIPVMMVSKNNQNIALTLPLEAKNSELKVAQYKGLDNKIELAKFFLLEKIERHNKHLHSLGVFIDISHIKETIFHCERINDLLGIEGNYSRVYFQHYFDKLPKILHKSKRSKRPALDPVNAMLSYVYMIIYNLITTRLTLRGFDPAISYLHTAFRSHYALSSDFMELYRADINALVMQWFLDDELSLEDFSKKDGVYLKYESRKQLWPQIKTLIDTVTIELDKEIASFKVELS